MITEKEMNFKPLTIRLETDLYFEFENKCIAMDKDREKIIEELVK